MKSSWRGSRVRLLGMVLLSGLLAANGTVGARASRGHPTPPIDLVSDRLLADAAVRGTQSRVLSEDGGQLIVLLATALGQTDAVARQVTAWNGTVLFAEPRVGYVRVRIPLERWLDVRGLPGVVASQVDALLNSAWRGSEDLGGLSLVTGRRGKLVFRRPRALTEADMAASPALTRAGAKLPPFQSDDLVGMDRLRAAHQTFDGRGVTIAVVEGTGISFEHSAFTRALTLDGRPIPKVRKLILPVPGWQRIGAQHRIKSSQTVAIIDGIPHILPEPGEYNFGTLRIGYQVFSVLWSRQGDRLWVDSNQDFDFRNEVELGDARRTLRRGRLVNSDWRDGVFSVTFDADREAVYFHPSSGHQDMVASVAAGVGGADSLAAGFAPGAALSLVDVGAAHLYAYVEGLIVAAREPDVDIITTSAIAPRGGVTQSSELIALVIDRIVQQFDKPIVQAAGNDFGPETPMPPGRLAISVGAAVSREALRVFNGSSSDADVRVWNYTSAGPTSEGLQKPDLVAPSERLSAHTCDGEAKKYPTVTLPACYRVSRGTSSAAPAVAGMLASLLSGARQTGLAVTAMDLRSALIESARPLPGESTGRQGVGMPQVDEAWQILRERRELPTIVSKAPVRHRLAPYATSPGVGTDLYEREGWVAGSRGSRTISLTRTTGDRNETRFMLRWRGNDGTFRLARSAEEFVLPLNQEVAVPIEINAATAGIHTAFLEVVQPSSGHVVHRLSAGVVVGQTFEDGDGPGLRYSERLQAFDKSEHPIVIPEGVHALRLQVETSGQAYVHLYEPGGRPYQHDQVDRRLFAHAFGLEAGRHEFAIPNPVAGTWIIEMAQESALEIGLPPSSVDVSLQLERADASATLRDVPDPRVETRLATLVRRQGEASTTGTPFVMDVPVEQGSMALLVRVSAATAETGPDTGLHLYLYDCSSGTCLRYDTSDIAQQTQVAYVERPAVGVWKVAVTPGPRAKAAVPFVLETAVAPSIPPQVNAPGTVMLYGPRPPEQSPKEKAESRLIPFAGMLPAQAPQTAGVRLRE